MRTSTITPRLLLVLLWLHSLGGFVYSETPGDGSQMITAEETETLVNGGLKWLASRQGKDGGWWPTEDEKPPIPPVFNKLSAASLQLLVSRNDYFVSVKRTASALSAFMAAGHTPNEGRYCDTVKAAHVFLLNSIGRDGLLCGGPLNVKDSLTNGSFAVEMSYNIVDHALVTTALCRLYGQTQVDNEREALLRLIAVIEGAQDNNGGWSPILPQNISSWASDLRQSNPDIRCTRLALRALRSAINAGIRVNPEVLKKAATFARDHYNENPQMAADTLRLCGNYGTPLSFSTPLVEEPVPRDINIWDLRHKGHFAADDSFSFNVRLLRKLTNQWHYLPELGNEGMSQTPRD